MTILSSITRRLQAVRQAWPTILLASAATLGGVAAAAGVQEPDAQAVVKMPVSLAQAIKKAEAHVSGRATHARLDKHAKGHWYYLVEVVAKDGAYDIKVDPTSGAILSSVPDANDDDEDDDDD